MSHIVLTGFQKAGKTALGQKLALQTKRDFIDTDKLLEHLYFKYHDRSLNCRDIYKHHGEIFFRELEKEVIRNVKLKEKSIIALGGGSVLLEENRQIISSLGKIIYLEIPFFIWKHRILSGISLPAFVDPSDPETSLLKVFTQREKIYHSLSDLKINLFRKNRSLILKELLSHVF